MTEVILVQYELPETLKLLQKVNGTEPIVAEVQPRSYRAILWQREDNTGENE